MTDRQALPTPSGFVWTFPAIVVRWIDGDTAICHIKVHPNEGGDLYEVNVRLEGINAPEMNTAAGQAAQKWAAALVPADTRVTLIARRRDKYGRFLATMVLPDGSDYSALTIAAGQAVPYLT